MYNKKSKASAVLAIVAALLMLGYLILLPITIRTSTIEGLEIVALILVSAIFILPLYAGGLAFGITGLVYGGKMRKQQQRFKLISFNRGMLIATCVLLPFIAFGMLGSFSWISGSMLGVVPIIYTVLTVLAYLASLIVNIATLVALKKTPVEIPAEAPAPTDQNAR